MPGRAEKGDYWRMSSLWSSSSRTTGCTRLVQQPLLNSGDKTPIRRCKKLLNVSTNLVCYQLKIESTIIRTLLKKQKLSHIKCIYQVHILVNDKCFKKKWLLMLFVAIWYIKYGMSTPLGVFQTIRRWR